MAVIKVDNVSKKYRLGVLGGKTLREDFKAWVAKKQGKVNPNLTLDEISQRREMGDIFWALKDINFSVKKGEILGIVGKNGAGKSTLLKLLSQITEPSTGEIKIKGKLASLLEVGTGFHPELTGRENIFLNGAILGMNKAEITEKIVEIINFSGIEHHIDTPVKRYSSGMKVRLGFAVAAHLDPEILVIDEVLAVGDAAFQQKCLGKMKDVAGQGRTVLFVSHNMNAVKSLCSRLILLDEGKITYEGDVAEGISKYLGADINEYNQSIDFKSGVYENAHMHLRSVKVISTNEAPAIITMDDPFHIEVTLEKKTDTKLDVTFQICDPEGNVLLGSGSGATEINTSDKTGLITFKCPFPAPFLNQGKYPVNILFVENNKRVVEQLYGGVTIAISPPNKSLGTWMGKSKGFFRPELGWKVE